MHSLSLHLLRAIVSLVILVFAAPYSVNAAQLKPRVVVLTDIATGNLEPDEPGSMVRFLAFADQFEVRGQIAPDGWNSSGRTYPASCTDALQVAIDAYEEDATN